jgi:hypothetical protein
MIFDTIWAQFFLLETKKNYIAELVSTVPLILMQELLNIIIRWDWQSAAVQLYPGHGAYTASVGPSSTA